VRHKREVARPTSCLTHLLVLLLCAQWGKGFAHCLAALQGTGHDVTICTADGLRTLTLDADGQPARPATTHEDCPVCPAGAALQPAVPSPPAAPIAYAAFLPRSPAGLPIAPARAPPQQPRAPPA